MLGTSVAAAQSRLVRGRREIIEILGPDSDPVVRRGRPNPDGEARPRRRKPRSLVLT
jgi:hypothetical protein